MMQTIKRFFFFHHFVIALGAIALCVQTLLFYGNTSGNTPLLLFMFFATLLSYNTHFFLAAQKSNATAQHRWFQQTRTFTLLFNLAAAFLTIWYWWQLKEIRLFIGLSVFINACYTAPLLLNNPIRLPKLLTYLKSYFIGFVWAWATVLLPVLFLQHSFGLPEVLLFINRLLLVAAATLIFDYRDKLQDFSSGVYTPANKMNDQQFSIFFNANVVLYAISVLFVSYSFDQQLYLLQLLCSPVLLVLFHLSKKQTHEYYYLGWVDGILILSPLLSLFLLF